MNVLAVKLTTHLASKNAKSTINSPVVNKVHATTNDQNSKGKLKMRELTITHYWRSQSAGNRTKSSGLP